MPFSLIPFLLLFIPILEIAVFILVGGQIGIAMTLAMILVTAIIGSILLRIQGISIISRIQGEKQAGRVPGRELGNGAMIMVAGVLLLTPGFVTDSLGFLLFVPPVRDLIWKFLASRVSVGVGNFTSGFQTGPGFSGGPRKHGDDVVDLDPDEYDEADKDVEIIEDHASNKKPGSGPNWSKYKD